jgi:malonyl-CoA O-methyltransferase
MQKKIIDSFNKAAKTYSSHDFLQRHVAQILLDKLSYIKSKQKFILDVGCGTGFLANKLLAKHDVVALDAAIEMCYMSDIENVVCANAASLPFCNNAFDLVVSNLMMQWLGDDLMSFLQESKRVVSTEGFVLFSTLGPNTLYEMQEVMAEVSSAEHVNSQLDMHIVGDLFIQAGFADVVMDRVMLTIEYKSFKHLLNDLRKTGANVILSQEKVKLNKKKLSQISDIYQNKYSSNGKIIASYEVVFAKAWGKSLPKNEVDVSSIKRG